MSAILASPAPVLAADACGILDLVRSQYRLEAPNRLLETTLGALGGASGQPPQLHLVVFAQVEVEVQRNLADEQKRLKQHLRTLDNTGSVLLPAREVAVWKRALENIGQTLMRLPQTWIDASHLVLPDAACLSRAQQRLAAGTAPGKRGSGNVGDCVIVEHLLEMAKSLRNANFAPSLLFVSSNIKDFGRSALKAPLDAEFGAVGVDYLPHIEAAMVQLGY